MREGQPCEADTALVQRGPALTAAAHRHPLTPSPLPAPGVRFVTYNILADQYTSQEYSQNVLFGYCPIRCRTAQLCAILTASQQAQQARLREVHTCCLTTSGAA